MGKMMNAFMLVAMIELGIYIFFNDVHTIGNSSLLNLILSPGTLSNNAIYTFLTSNLFTILVAAGLVASLTLFKVDFPIYAAMAATIITWVASIIDLWLIIDSRTYLGDEQTRNIIAALIVGPLLIYYIFALADWVRGRD